MSKKMATLGQPAFPRTRTQNLITRKLDGEILVYDRDRDKASCLNAFAGEVWVRCDGQTSPSDIAQLISKGRLEAVDERSVWLALDQLSRARLLEEAVTMPPSVLGGTSRREALRTLGLSAAAAVPAVMTILVPSVADAASCLPPGQICAINAQCCSNICSGRLCL